MPLTIEMQFSDRFEFQTVSQDYRAKPGEIVVQALTGPVRRTSIGPGLSTTTFSNDTVIERWQADRQAASAAMTAEGASPLAYKSDEVLVAEHLVAGIVEENSPGVMTAVKVTGGQPKFNKKLEQFLRLYFNVQEGDDSE